MPPKPKQSSKEAKQKPRDPEETNSPEELARYLDDVLHVDSKRSKKKGKGRMVPESRKLQREKYMKAYLKQTLEEDTRQHPDQ